MDTMVIKPLFWESAPSYGKLIGFRPAVDIDGKKCFAGVFLTYSKESGCRYVQIDTVTGDYIGDLCNSSGAVMPDLTCKL
jgi:hypothetical protein